MRTLCLMILSLCMLILSGCATINSDIKVNKDGSGTWDATITSKGGPIEKKIITDTLTKNNVQSYTIKAPNADGNMTVVEDADTTSREVWKIETKFANGTELERMRDAITTRLKGKSSEPALQKTSDGHFIIDLGRAPGTTNITVDGEILRDSVQDGTAKNNTVTFPENKQIHFTFKPSPDWFLYGSIGISIVIIGGLFYIFILHRKTK